MNKTETWNVYGTDMYHDTLSNNIGSHPCDMVTSDRNQFSEPFVQDSFKSVNSQTSTDMDFLVSNDTILPSESTMIPGGQPINNAHYNDVMDNFFNNTFQQSVDTNAIDSLDFDSLPQRVDSVYSTTSSYESFTEESSRTTEQSQEEILEEIQRECAEIERRSTSPSEHKKHRRSGHTRSSRALHPEERKKELNRVAAAKYREKKRIERSQKLLELRDLESRNTDLRSKATALENEIAYLKNLIDEIRNRS